MACVQESWSQGNCSYLPMAHIPDLIKSASQKKWAIRNNQLKCTPEKQSAIQGCFVFNYPGIQLKAKRPWGPFPTCKKQKWFAWVGPSIFRDTAHNLFVNPAMKLRFPPPPQNGAASLLNVHLQPAGMFLLSRLRSQQGVGCPTQAGWVAQRGLQQPAPAASAILHPTAPHPNTHPMQPFPRANGQTTSCHCSRNKARTTPFFCK